MNERQMHRADFLTGLVLLAFGLTALILSIQMPRLENKQINPFTVPGIVPGFLGAIISIMSLALVIRAILNRGYALGVTAQSTRAWIHGYAARNLSITLVLSLVYALVLIGRIPYPLATFLFVFAFVCMFEWRRDASREAKRRVIAVAALEAVLTALVVSGVFRYLFLVDLP